MDAKLIKIIDDIAEKGWALVDNFLSDEQVKNILQEQVELFREGAFRKAGIGKGENFQVRPEIRGDHVMWIDTKEASDHVNVYLNKIEALRQKINEEFYIGLKSFECHFATYPPESFYKKHLDQFKQVKYRILTCILYLNQQWTYKDGGLLRIYKDGENESDYIDIVPKAGTFVCFKSAEIYHEVLPTSRQRYSITGWLRNIDDD